MCGDLTWVTAQKTEHWHQCLPCQRRHQWGLHQMCPQHPPCNPSSAAGHNNKAMPATWNLASARAWHWSEHIMERCCDLSGIQQLCLPCTHTLSQCDERLAGSYVSDRVLTIRPSVAASTASFRKVWSTSQPDQHNAVYSMTQYTHWQLNIRHSLKTQSCTAQVGGRLSQPKGVL